MAIMYRGIALDPLTFTEDVANIRETGNLAAKSRWCNTMPDPVAVRELVTELERAPTKVRSEISKLPQTPLTYACGDFEGAVRYALSVEGIPVVIALEVPFDSFVIDGKDFLYTVFQLSDAIGADHRNKVRSNLSALFGATMVDWFDRANRESELMARMGICDLAVCDLAAIKAHHQNTIDIAGKCNRVFRSAFALPREIAPSAILDVKQIFSAPPPPTRTIHFASDMLEP